MAKTTLRNTLTIAEAKDILCAEHAARLFVAEAWWTIVPNKGDGYAATGNAQPFWALMNATLELGMALGFEKVENKLRKLVNVPHSDPEKVLRSLIKIQPRAQLPNMGIIKARCNISGKNPDDMYNAARLEYDEEVAAEVERVNQVIKDIMKQMPATGDGDPFESTTKLGAFNEETGAYDEYEVNFGEHLIPIDRIIEFGERQLKFLASNDRVPDIIFGTEKALWDAELEQLGHIVQQQENEGAAPDFVAAIDDQLLTASGMAAGMNSGKN
jgi:hypothetical protein